MSVILNIADGVTAELNVSAPSGLALGAVRQIRPRRDLQDLAGRAITVVPRSLSISGATRSAQAVECKIDVAVQQRLPGTESQEIALIDELVNLVQQIIDYLARRPLTTVPGAAWIGVANDPIYIVEHLDELRVFTSVITLTYRVMR